MIQSLNQKVEELYVEIVDLKKREGQRIQLKEQRSDDLKEQRSDDLMMGVESSIKGDRLSYSPIGDLEGISPKKGLMKQR